MKEGSGLPVPICPKCGCEIPENANFCPACGMASSKQNLKHQNNFRKHMPYVIVLILICILAFFTSYVLTQVSSFSNSPQKIKEASASVVLVKCYDGDGNLYCTGSAFSAFQNDIFITNYHVIEETKRIIALTEDGSSFGIDTVLAFDSQKDIAILKASNSTGILPLDIGSSDSLEKGQKVVAIGSPLGFLNTVSSGVFSGYNMNGSPEKLQFSASISQGSSGGALFDDRGRVIGITCGSYVDGQSLNLAVPIQQVVELMSAASTPMTLRQFYETSGHHVTFTVSEVIMHRDDISEENAYIYGFISDIEGQQCYLVTNPNEIEEFTFHPFEGEMFEAVTDGRSAQYEERLNNSAILLIDNTISCQLFARFKVGDYVRICTKLDAQSTYYSDQYKIYIQTSDSIIKIP